MSVKCRIIEVKNPAEELTKHILLALVVGYFADAQYDVLFYTSFFVHTPDITKERIKSYEF